MYICERICDKGTFGTHFWFWVRHMVWKYIWWASFCTLLRCTSLFHCQETLVQSVEWQEVCFRENGPKHLLPVKTATFHVTNDIIVSMAESAQHTVSFTAVYLMWTSPETSLKYDRFFWKASRSQYDGTEHIYMEGWKDGRLRVTTGLRKLSDIRGDRGRWVSWTGAQQHAVSLYCNKLITQLHNPFACMLARQVLCAMYMPSIHK